MAQPTDCASTPAHLPEPQRREIVWRYEFRHQAVGFIASAMRINVAAIRRTLDQAAGKDTILVDNINDRLP